MHTECFCNYYEVWITLDKSDYNRNTCDIGGDCEGCEHSCQHQKKVRYHGEE